MNTYYNKNTKIWTGIEQKFRFGPQDSIGAVALRAMLQNPDHIGQICYQSGKEFTNRQLVQLSVQVAQYFQKLPLHQGDIIGLCATNSDYVAPLFFGAMIAGLCISTLDPSYDKEGIKQIFSLTRPKIIFCDGDNYHRVQAAFDDCGLSSSIIVTMRNHIRGVANILEYFEEGVEVEDFRVSSLEKGYHQTAALLCTSGTTGIPKIVSMSHAAIMNYSRLPKAFPVTILCFSSLHWFSGLTTLVNGTFFGATRIISEKPFSANDFFNIAKSYKVNILVTPPTQIALSLSSVQLADSDLSSIRAIVVSGSSVAYSMIEKFQRYVPNAIAIVVYSMTEVCTMVTQGVCESSNTVGHIHENVQVKIIDDLGNLLGPNQPGELCVRPKLPWAGYYNNSAATKAIYDANGWIHSGDIGYFNNTGQLFVVDRISDIRKYNNFHFSPTEIETVIKELDQVADVCVVGIPDSTYGFLPAAAVIKRPNTEVDIDHICRHVAGRMEHFNHLRGGIFFFPSLPHTVSGKHLRQEVVRMCQRQNSKQKFSVLSHL